MQNIITRFRALFQELVLRSRGNLVFVCVYGKEERVNRPDDFIRRRFSALPPDASFEQELSRVFVRAFYDGYAGGMILMSSEKVTISSYRQIAIDIAENIINGKYAQGEKLFGRSVLASHYKVSPETIRKAVFLLKDVGIVETEKGSGIEIISTQKAIEFLKHNNNIGHMASIKKEIEDWAKEQSDQAVNILRKIQYVINETERINAISPLNPFQIRITRECGVIGKTVDELCFWHITGGTVVAIRRGETLIVSPGPYATVCEGDFFFIIGDEDVYSATMKLFYA